VNPQAPLIDRSDHEIAMTGDSERSALGRLIRGRVSVEAPLHERIARVRYVPYSELVGLSHIICDGSTRKSTMLTLSHWPDSGTPADLLADLSAEIVLRYLRSPAHHVDVDAVSNDHFDLDGFMSVWAMVNPEAALAAPELVSEVARAGDFACTSDRRAARIAFALGSFRREDDKPAEQYLELLPRFADLAEHIEDHGQLWEDEDEELEATEAAFDARQISIEENVDLDLAIVTIDPSIWLWGEHRFSILGRSPCHPIPLHNRTDRFRVLYRQGDWAGLVYRFESWVQFQSRRVLPRVDLTELATALSGRDEHEWTFAWPRQRNPPTAWLTSWAPSRIPFDEIRERIELALSAGEDVFDPYATTPVRYR
jgi:hypothetical protein